MSKQTVLFIDTVAPRKYSPTLMQGCGGTEMTVVDVAEGLASTNEYEVFVEQYHRDVEDLEEHRASYNALGTVKKADIAIVLRNPGALIPTRERFRDAKLFLWSHDLANQGLGACFHAGMFEYSRTAANVCVSQWHRTQTIETLKPWGYTGQFKMRSVYNPLPDYVVRSEIPYDKNKLLWLASPHKGLDRAYEIFEYLVKLNGDFRLYVANPGYLDENGHSVREGVIKLGSIPNNEVIQHLRDSLCLFYPNSVFPETFGRILAESNGVGTPVLTHALGACKEVLDTHPDQFVNCQDTEAVIKRVLKWYEGQRPVVRGNPKFKLSTILSEWRKLFNDNQF